MNSEIESILSDIEDILTQRFTSKEWSAQDIADMEEGLEVLREDCIEGACEEDMDEDVEEVDFSE